MKNEKKKAIVIISFFLILGMFWLLDTDRYIHRNISVIDKADSFKIVSKSNVESYPFDEKFFKLVSYGGSIIKSDNFFEQLTTPYINKLIELDIKIEYFKGESKLGTADIYRFNDNSEEYILYMNNVYWTTPSKLIDLLDLIE